MDIGEARRQLQQKGALPQSLPFGDQMDHGETEARKLTTRPKREAIEQVMEKLSASRAAYLQSQLAKDSRCWIPVPPPGKFRMPDEDWRSAVRHRLLLPAPSVCTFQEDAVCCHAASMGGTRCGHRLDPDSRHEALCQAGGGIVRRHNRLRNWVAQRYRATADCRVAEEVHWSALDIHHTTGPKAGTTEEARIDVVVQNLHGTQLLDVAVAAVATVDARELARRFFEPGRPGRETAKRKRKRYGTAVTPIVIEDTGRLHVEARKMFRHFAREATDTAQEQRSLIGEFQAIMFTASMQAQRAARGASRA